MSRRKRRRSSSLRLADDDCIYLWI
jgi:hypothetical protein